MQRIGDRKLSWSVQVVVKKYCRLDWPSGVLVKSWLETPALSSRAPVQIPHEGQ